MHASILSLRFFSRSKSSIILRASKSTFRLPAFNRARYRFHPLLLFGFGKHAERYLNHVLGGVGPKASTILAAARHHSVKYIHILHLQGLLRVDLHGRLYAEARRLLLLLLLLVISRVALTLLMIGSIAVRVVVTYVNHYTDFLLSDVGAELFDQVLPLLLKRGHLIEDSSNHVSIRAVPSPSHSRWSHWYPASMLLLPLLLAGLCHLVVVIRLINVFECLQPPLARTMGQMIATSLFRSQTYPWRHVSY